MKQVVLFSDDPKQEAEESIYTKTTAKNLIYEPSKQKPHIEKIVDRRKTLELESKIELSNVTEKEKSFLKLAAQRHNGFNYDLCADYYSHASKEMQTLMEESGLVIVDFNRAIELGFVQLSERISNQYTSEHQ